MNRRALLQGIAALSAGLILPPTLIENAEAERRFWALDRTMVSPIGDVQPSDYGQLAYILSGLFGQPIVTSEPMADQGVFHYKWEWVEPRVDRRLVTYTITNSFGDEHR